MRNACRFPRPFGSWNRGVRRPPRRMETHRPTTSPDRDRLTRSVFSLVLPDGGRAEMVHDRHENRTRFAVRRDGTVTYESSLRVGERTFTPYSPRNTLLEHDVILLPQSADPYASDTQLLADITAFLHRYVDLNPTFERLASYYVLLTWV